MLPVSGILTTYGTGFPRYSRETVCNIDPQLFVELEAQGLSHQFDDGIGIAVAIFKVTNGVGFSRGDTYIHRVGCGDLIAA